MLEIQGLSAFYGHIEALRAVDMHVLSGKITTLIGANGAGKSTLLRVISGLIPSRYGKIIYVGKDVTNLSPDRLVKLGICQVPEGRQVFNIMSVRENLEMGAYLRYRRESSSDIRRSLDYVYELFPVLKEREGQEGGTLSGGEQQMLAIGRAIMSKPRLLLLDEPSMGLAPKVIRDIFNCLDQLHQAGLTILLVEQDVQLALRIADYGYVLRAGKLALEGDASDLLANDSIKEIYLGE
jgi:branched-chain amino acid transport system ATP-binding protein